jgi:hypothetical protein
MYLSPEAHARGARAVGPGNKGGENEAPACGAARAAQAQERPSLFERAPYKQQAVENHSIICQMKTEPSSWTTAAAKKKKPCERQTPD